MTDRRDVHRADRLPARGDVRVCGQRRGAGMSPSTSTPARSWRSSARTAPGKSTIVKGLLGLSDQLGGEVELFGTPLDRFGRSGDHRPPRLRPAAAHPLRLGARDRRGDRRHRTAGAAVAGSAGPRPPTGTRHRPRPRRRRPRRPRRRPTSAPSPAASSAGSSSPARWPRSPTSCSWTSRPPGSTPPTSTCSPRCSAGWPRRASTMLIVTHEMDAFVDVVTRVVVVDRGGVVFDGPRDVFLAREAEVAPRAPQPPPRRRAAPTRGPRCTGDAEAGPTGEGADDRAALLRLHAAGPARGRPRRPRRPARRRLPRAAPAVADRRRDGPRRPRRRRRRAAHQHRARLDGAGRRRSSRRWPSS